MWFLTQASSGRIIYLKKNKTSIGRKGSDVEIEDDASISRVHAEFIIDNKVLKVKDSKSKYGTFVNDPGDESTRLKDEQVEVKNGDRIRLGRLQSNWIVHNLELKTVTSMLEPTEKQKLVKLLKTLDVQLAEALDSTCSHLTTPKEAPLSMKLLEALSSCTPIVTQNYWLAVNTSISNNQPLPKHIDFAPKIKDEMYITPGTVSLVQNEKRKKLFAGKTFMFLSRSQMAGYDEVIKSAGGNVQSMTQTKLKLKDVCHKNSIVIKPKVTETQTQNDAAVSQIKTTFEEKRRRMVDDTEIGLAILHCSVEKWCNPEFQMEALFEPSQSVPLKISKSKVIAPNTDVTSEQMNSDPAASTSRPRGRPKKIQPQPAKISAVIELSDDDDDIAMDGINKENIPATLPPTQDIFMTQDEEIAATPVNISISQTQQSQAESWIEPPRNDVSIAPTQNDEPSQPPSSAGSRRANQASASSIDSSSLFNFTNVSTSTKRTQKRIHSSESDEDELEVSKPPPAKTKPKSQVFNVPEPKRSKNVPEEAPRQSSRKRHGEPANNLFQFNIAKKPKRVEEEPQAQVTVSKNTFKQPSPAKMVVYDDYEDDGDSGWLSKAFLSASLNDSVDGIKTEIKEEIDTQSNVDTQNLKLDQLPTLIRIIESTQSPSASSTVSKRKQFVKKRNYKPQTEIIPMTIVKLEDTYKSIDDF